MSEFRRVTDGFWVSPQISIDDVVAAKAAGFTLIINNRPDDESPGQPKAQSIEAAAHHAGLDYLYAPVTGRPGEREVRDVRAAVDGAHGKVLAFCRSGTRSIYAWALGQAADHGHDELIRLGEAAGYDLRAVLDPAS
jgi:uncharacterized protein (TIGR01244 family)